MLWPSQRAPGFPADALLTWAEKTLVMWTLLSDPGGLGWGAQPGVENPSSSGGPFKAKRALQDSQLPSMGAGCTCSASRPFLPVSARFLLCIPSCQTSVQLVFHWLFGFIVLYFSCNSTLVLGGGMCIFRLLCCHLGCLSDSF